MAGKVPEGSPEDISDLCCELRVRAKIKIPSVTKTNKESEAEFYGTLEQNRTSAYHLESVGFANTQWKREDLRVSKEIFVLKVNTGIKKQPQLIY
jgi:hypothetical protein